MFRLVTSSEQDCCSRKEFYELLNQGKEKILEIAPLDNPFVKTENTFYFDVLPRDDLQKKAITLGRDPSKVPDIHYHHPNGDLAIVDSKFDAVFSSHCIEHTPDIISHLCMVKNLLAKGGQYFLLVPDKRYTFDRFKPLSQVEEMIEAFRLKAQKPSLKQFMQHSLYRGTHNNRELHWQGEHGENPYRSKAKFIPSIVKTFEESSAYLDVHAWIFTPSSFLKTLKMLHFSGLLKVSRVAVHETPSMKNEFAVVIQFH